MKRIEEMTSCEREELIRSLEIEHRAAISAVPTLFFLVLWLGDQTNQLSAFLTLWSAAWTGVWWSLRHR